VVYVLPTTLRHFGYDGIGGTVMSSIQQSIGAALSLSLLGGAGTLVVRTQESPRQVAWPHYGGDRTFTRYSPLDQINRNNVGRLRIAWRRPGIDPRLTETFPDLSPSPYFRSTPIMIDGVLYGPDAVGLAEGFDGASGKTIWVQEAIERGLQGVAGQSTRGMDFWRNGSDQRVAFTRGEYLYVLDAKTGKYIREFGEGGRVNLHRDSPFSDAYRWTGGPTIVGDVVVVAGNGGGTNDLGVVKEGAPEDVRGYDVRTGKLLWTFHVVPRPGEFGADTWGGDSLNYSGTIGAYGAVTADEALGYVYVPLTAPSTLYGGHRLGQNLFASSLVCLDAKTGKRVWHFQMVHHDIWDYDNESAPVLGDVTVNGKRIKTVMQPNKNGFLFVFDRVTGEPVWPIEERPVPQSTVPGEHTWPTQPFPTKPPPFDRQGLTEDDLIDFTPALRAEAVEFLKSYVIGPLYTPPSLVNDEPGGKKGTFVNPGTWGAANWHTGAFDPETGMFYAVSHTIPYLNDLVKPSDPKATLQYALKQTSLPVVSPERVPTRQGAAASRARGDSVQRMKELIGPSGLPLTKPPYGRITAFDMNRGEQTWMVPNGDGPRNHPLLKDLHLPPLGSAGRAAPLVTKSLLFVGEGSDAIPGLPKDAWGRNFRAYDKTNGKVLWEIDLPAGTSGGPMTYMSKGKQYIVVPIGGRDYPPEWIALGLP
jgi:quinoprotein glucose dehydrogenase